MRLAVVLLALALAPPARAEGQPGAFDYYVLALSWSPTWCALEGAERGSPQCDPEADFGWMLHGLWPQYERGWPSDCQSGFDPPSRARTAAMADIMGTSSLAWHQWRKHGTCSGLDPDAYFRLSRRAFEGVARPGIFRRLDAPVRLPAAVVEEAFLEANPGLSADEVTITCRAGRIQEARLCLTRDLAPRRCGADVVADCALRDALMAPVP